MWYWDINKMEQLTGIKKPLKVKGILLFNNKNIDWQYLSQFIETHKCKNIFYSGATSNTEEEDEQQAHITFYISNDNNQIIFTATSFNSSLPEPLSFSDENNMFMTTKQIIRAIGPCTLTINPDTISVKQEEIKSILFVKENQIKMFYNQNKNFDIDCLSFLHSNLVYNDFPMEDINEQVVLDTYRIYEELIA